MSSEGRPLALAQPHLTCTSYSQSSRVRSQVHRRVQPDTLPRDVRAFPIILSTSCRSWRLDIFNFHLPTFLANLCVSIQRGDEALAGREEYMPSHYFPPDATNNRTIYFKGIYLLIVNKQTGDQATYEDNKTPTTQFVGYEIPAGYTCYVRGATVYFEV